MMKLRTLIADDEPLARERLRYLLAEDAEIVITAECRNGREVLAALRDSRIDVMFLDIQMPGRAGFQVIEEVGSERMPITVFVTGYDHYAVRAFEVHALDYLTKPVEAERLRATLKRIKEQIAAREALTTQEKLRAVLAMVQTKEAFRAEYPARLLVPEGSKDFFVSVSDIDWIEAADYYVCLHVGARSLMLRDSIKQLASTLDPAKFVRIHRSAIVNVDRVKEIFHEGRSEGCVVLANGQRLRMSKVGWQSLLAVSRNKRNA